MKGSLKGSFEGLWKILAKSLRILKDPWKELCEDPYAGIFVISLYLQRSWKDPWKDLLRVFERSLLNPWGSWRILEKNFARILMRIFVISFEDLYQILEDLNKRFCLQRSLRIFYRSFKDLLKILVLKDLWQVFVNPWRSSKLLWGFSPRLNRSTV